MFNACVFPYVEGLSRVSKHFSKLFHIDLIYFSVVFSEKKVRVPIQNVLRDFFLSIIFFAPSVCFIYLKKTSVDFYLFF